MPAANKFPIDEPLFSWAELLEFTGLTLGAAKGHLKRGIVVPSVEFKGSGFHVRYTGRDLMRFAAVAYTSKAGVGLEWIQGFVGRKVIRQPITGAILSGELDLVIDDYAKFGSKSAYSKRSPFVFNAVAFGGSDVHRVGDLGSPRQIFEDIKNTTVELRKLYAVTYVCFDAWVFVSYAFEALQSLVECRTEGTK